MHYTHEEEEARRAEIDAAKATRSSAEALLKPAGPVGSLCCDALVLSPVRNVEILCTRWKVRRDKEIQRRKHAAKVDDFKSYYEACAAGDVLGRCIKELRAQMESATERQPEENKKAQTRSGESPSA